MTVQLKLPPDLELLVRDRANEEFHGDLDAMVQTALREYLQLNEQSDELEQMLLDGINSGFEPIPDDFCEQVAERARLRKAARAN